MFNKRIYSTGLVVFVFFITLACGALAAAPTPTPTTDPATPAAMTALVQTADAQVAQATADAKSTADAQATLDAAARATEEVEPALDATAALSAQATLDQAATVSARATGTKEAMYASLTQRAEKNQTATAEAKVKATETAGGMLSRVQALYDDGILTRTEGKYHTLDDFDESWAQLGWYMWWPTGLYADDYVVHTTFHWRSASDHADWWNSGCGFVFRLKDNRNHYTVYLALDGNVYLGRVADGYWTTIGAEYYGPVEYMDGSAEILFAVEDSRFTFFVDGKRVLRESDATHTKGEFALTLNSGTNKDFGTSCEMTDIEIWELK